jgi:hypothetical protein
VHHWWGVCAVHAMPAVLCMASSLLGTCAWLLLHVWGDSRRRCQHCALYGAGLHTVHAYMRHCRRDSCQQAGVPDQASHTCNSHPQVGL